jgi:hypothetical protein
MNVGAERTARFVAQAVGGGVAAGLASAAVFFVWAFRISELPPLPAETWVDQSTGETGYLIEARPDGGTTFGFVGWASANATSGTATFYETGAGIFELRVRPESSNNSTISTSGASVNVTLPAFPSPTGVEAEAVDWDELHVTWDNPAGNDVYMFMIEYREVGTSTWLEVFGNYAMYGGEAHPGQYGGGYFEADTTYELRIRPYLGWMTQPKPPSGVVEVTTPPYPSPTDVEAVAVDWDELHVTWEDPSDDAYVFMIEYREVGTSTWLEVFGNYAMYGGEAHPGQYGGGYFEADTTYELRIRPYLGWLTVPMPPSEVVEVTTPPYPSPADVVATPLSSTSARITWEDPSDDAYYFEVEVRVQGTSTWSWAGTVCAYQTLELTAGYLTAATTYEVRVVPWLNSSTPMAPSAVVTFSTP